MNFYLVSIGLCVNNKHIGYTDVVVSAESPEEAKTKAYDHIENFLEAKSTETKIDPENIIVYSIASNNGILYASIYYTEGFQFPNVDAEDRIVSILEVL